MTKTINALKQQFLVPVGRLLSRFELDGEIRHYVEDKILFREALFLDFGLTVKIVRRRLIGTMEFLNAEVTAFKDPAENRLRVDYFSHRFRASFVAENARPESRHGIRYRTARSFLVL